MSQHNITELAVSGQLDIDGSVLASSGQELAETLALEIMGRAEIAEARVQLSALFKADRNVWLADQEPLINQSIDEHCFHASLIAANETPACPHFVWSIALGHSWMGSQIPGSRMGQDNPDNVYRFACIDPTMRYKITGRFVTPQPIDFTLCSLPAQVGEGIAADVCSIITRDTINLDAEGYFEIIVDATATEGRRNHLSIAGARVLMVRDTLADWGAERPSELSITRLNGEMVDDFDIEKAAPRAAYLANTIAAFFLNMVQHGMCEVGPLNTVPAPMASAGRGGLVTQTASLGYYRLGDGEALVLNIDPLGALYLGVQLCDMWMLSYDYSQHASSLNNSQAMTDADGRIRLVISAQDPGVHNWLDGSGNALGTILLRWHSIPAGADFSNGVISEVVKISELPSFLPKETKYLNGKARSEQQEKRFQDYLGRVYA